MAQVVGQRRAVLVGAARQHEQVGRIGQQHLERHLAAARQAIVAAMLRKPAAASAASARLPGPDTVPPT